MAYQTVRQNYYTNPTNGVRYDLQYDTSTGNVQIIQQNAPSGTSPIYYDGSWTTAASSLNIPAATQNSLHQDLKPLIRSAHTQAGGNSRGARLPQYVQQGNTSPPSQGVAPPSPNPSTNNNVLQNIGNLVSALGQPLATLNQFSINNRDIWGSVLPSDRFSTPMVYPLDLAVNKQDTLVITAHRYQPPNPDFLGSDNFVNIIQNGLLRGSTANYEEVIGQVTFPMPSSVVDKKDVNWGGQGTGDTLNSLNAAVANRMGSNPLGLALPALAAGAASGVANAAGVNVGNPLSNAMNTAKFAILADAMTNAAGSTGGQAMIGAGMVEYLTNALGFGVPAETILSRGAGLVSNDNLELLFGGPTLRMFAVSYRMTARSPEEAEEINRIIRFFKQVSSPKKNRGAAGNRSVLLGTPDVFRLRFLTSGGTENPNISRFKTVALTSIQTDFTPDRFWIAYEAGQPVSSTITLQFNELEPIYENDYSTSISNNNSANRTSDLREIPNNSVGY